MSVSEISIDSTTAMLSTQANSWNRRPVTPGISSSGRNTATSETVSDSTVKPIWRAPISAASLPLLPCSM
ncbi:hypothetical protein D3C72_2010090 [compost metagenome]